MKREENIFEFQNIIIPNVDVKELIENFKKEHSFKINVELEPLLNAILTNKNLNTEDKDKLIESIENNIQIYVSMDKNILISLIDYISNNKINNKLKFNNLVYQIQNDNIPNELNIKKIYDEYKKLNVKLKDIINIKYKNLLLRYINWLREIFSYTLKIK